MSNVRCSGLRFLRLIYLLNTPELLQLLHIIKSNNHIRIAKALSVVLIVWVLGASVYFLVCDTTSTFTPSSSSSSSSPLF